MAAAYLLHICQNHAFIDGNKRSALAAALVFLRINGIVVPFSELLYDLTMETAQGCIEKPRITDELQCLAGAAESEPLDGQPGS